MVNLALDDGGEDYEERCAHTAEVARAFNKARQLRPRIHKHEKTYFVASSGGGSYALVRDRFEAVEGADGWRCGCAAGANGRMCYHVAALLIHLHERDLVIEEKRHKERARLTLEEMYASADEPIRW